MASKLFVLTSQAGELLRKKRIPSLLQKMDHKIAALSPLASEAYFELIVPEEKLGKRVLWFNDRPFRDSGGFHPRKLTRSAKWKGFFQDDNPNASLTWQQGNGGRGRLRKTSFQLERPTYDSLTGRYSFALTLLNGSRIPFRRKDEIAITSLSLFIDDARGQASPAEVAGNVVQTAIDGYSAYQTYTSIKAALQTALERLKGKISATAEDEVEGWSKISNSWMEKLDSYIQEIENIKLDSDSSYGDLKAFIQEDDFTQNMVSIFTDSGAGGLSTEEIADQIGDSIDPVDLVDSLRTIVQSQAEAAYDVLSNLYASGGDEAIFTYYTNTFGVRPSEFWTNKEFYSDFTNVVQVQDAALYDTLTNFKEQVQDAQSSGEFVDSGALDSGVADSIASTASDDALIESGEVPELAEFVGEALLA